MQHMHVSIFNFISVSKMKYVMNLVSNRYSRKFMDGKNIKCLFYKLFGFRNKADATG